MLFFAPSTALLLLALCGSTIAQEIFRITTPKDLIDFSNNVNNNSSLSKVDAYLDSDIEFTPALSQQFQPIGVKNMYFQGTFDGQGYVIRNLAITTPSSFDYTGLLGYSVGVTVRNLVMDASCSVSSSTSSTTSSSDYTFVGGIIGVCFAFKAECLIENSVNMGSVSFGGSLGCNRLHIGGIAGDLWYNKVDSMTIRNCVNYGAIENTGASDYALIGGILGSFSGDGKTKYIQNCANYGPITHSGQTNTRLSIGGIVGSTQSVKVENCLSAGEISSTNIPSDNNQGAIIGYASINTYINYCHFTNDVGVNKLYGTYNTALPSVTESSSSPVSLDSTLLENLGTQTLKNDTWSKWSMLHLKGGKINDLTQETLIVTQKHFPDPVKDGNTFLYWCINEECAEIYNPNTTNISEVTDLYAHYQGIKYAITFIFDNGNENEVRTLNFNEAIVYPGDPTKEGYIFNGWSPKPERMPAESITVTANWTESTLESGSSSESDSSSQSRSSSEGSDSSHSISSSESDSSSQSGSSSESSDSSQSISSSESDFSSHSDSSSVAKKSSESSDVFTEYVEVIFGKKGLTEEDVKEILQEFTKEDFVIGMFEVDNESGEIKVIVGFADSSKAAEFARNINENKGGLENNLIKRVTIVSEQTSFASISIPVLSNLFLI